MKMKKYNYILSKKLLFAYLLLLSLNGFAQTEKSFYTIGLSNVINTANTLEMDVTFTIDIPTKGTKLSQISVGINYNTSILNDGTPCNSKNCGSWIYIGGKSAAISGLTTTFNTTNIPYGHLRIVGTPLNYNSSITIQNGTYTLGRYRFINSVPWANNSNAQLWLQSTNQGNKTNTIISSYPNDTSRKLVANTTSLRVNSKAITLQYTSESPLNFILNSKMENNPNFNAVAYPNPYAEDFHLDVQTLSESTIQIKVYDMLGKLIENRNIETSNIQNVSIGSNYPTGIYTINVSQGANNHTLRIIKR